MTACSTTATATRGARTARSAVAHTDTSSAAPLAILPLASGPALATTRRFQRPAFNSDG
jgi:hypothetical protein